MTKFDYERERSVLLRSIGHLEELKASASEALRGARNSLEVLKNLEKQDHEEDQGSVLSLSLKEFGLSARICTAFKYDRIFTVRDLVRLTEDVLLAIPNFGQGSLRELKIKLESHGLTLANKSG